MQRAGAAERDEGEVARVVPALDRDDAQRTQHLRVHDRDDRARVDRRRARARRRRGRARRRRRAAPAARPSSEVGVGDRRLRAAAPVARRARVGAGALGADAQRAARRRARAIEPPPAPTVCRSTVGSRIGSPATTRSLVRSARPSVIRQTSVDVPPMSNAIASGNPAAARDPRRADRSGRRARRRARAPDARRPRRPSATPPDERITSGSGSPAPTAAARERAQVARRDGPEVRVGRGRRRALVLAELRRDLVRGDDVRVRQPPSQLVGDGALVVGVAVRVQQADGDRLGVELGQRVELERRRARRPGPCARGRRRSARAGRAAPGAPRTSR